MLAPAVNRIKSLANIWLLGLAAEGIENMSVNSQTKGNYSESFETNFKKGRYESDIATVRQRSDAEKLTLERGREQAKPA